MKDKFRCTDKICSVEQVKIEALSSSSCDAAVPISTYATDSFGVAQEVQLDDEDVVVMEATTFPEEDDLSLPVNYMEEHRIASRSYSLNPKSINLSNEGCSRRHCG